MEINRRQRQVGAVLKRAIAEVIQQNLDPRESGLVTVIDVIVTPNRAKTEIWLSALKSSPSLEARLEELVPLITEAIHQHIHQRRKLHVSFRIANG